MHLEEDVPEGRAAWKSERIGCCPGSGCQIVNGKLVSYFWDYFLMCKRHIGALAVQISDPIQKIVGRGNQKDVTTG